MTVTFLNTRPLARSDELNEILSSKGIQVINIPLVALEPVTFNTPGQIHFENYNGLFYSSINGLHYFEKSLTEGEIKKCREIPVYTLSKGVRQKLPDKNMHARFFSKKASLNGFLSEYRATGDERWLHPCSAKTRLDPESFKGKNITIENLPVYRPRVPAESFAKLSDVYASLDVLLFTSGTGVQHFREWTVLAEFSSLTDSLKGKQVISFGSSVSEILIKEGFSDFRELKSADIQEIPGLIQ